MREYGKLYASFWTSPDIAELPDDEKILAAYCLTSPHSNLIGCFRLPIAYAAEDLRKPFESLVEAFAKLQNIGFLTYDKRHQWVVIHKFLKWNQFESPNVAKSALKVLESVPTNSLVFPIALKAYGSFCRFKDNDISKAFERLSEGLAKASESLVEDFANPEPEPEPEPLPEPEPEKAARAKNPEPEEIPGGLDLQAWGRWVTYRRSIKKPIKPASTQAAQRALAGFGPRQGEVVEQSIANGWQGLFALRETRDGRSSADRRAAHLAELGGYAPASRTVDGEAERVD